MAEKPRLPDRETPVTDIVMRKVRIVRSGPAAQSFDAAAAFARQDEIRAKRDAARNKAADEFRAELQRDEARATRTPSGLRYIIEQQGKGDPPQPGDALSVHCTGWLAADGTRFWSTRDQAEPFRFAMGAGKVIKGWEEAFASMRPGEKRRLIIPPELGYGATGNARAGIPSNATLVFDVELLDIERH
jgi:peptidylprolyl isomerase